MREAVGTVGCDPTFEGGTIFLQKCRKFRMPRKIFGVPTGNRTPVFTVKG
jgi:hypothetical protein